MEMGWYIDQYKQYTVLTIDQPLANTISLRAKPGKNHTVLQTKHDYAQCIMNSILKLEANLFKCAREIYV